MNFRNISAWAIRNPVTPLVLFAALVMAGVVSFLRMDVNQNPDISFPLVSVTVVQPGAAPTELETQVTQRIEAAVRGLAQYDLDILTVHGDPQVIFEVVGKPKQRGAVITGECGAGDRQTH